MSAVLYDTTMSSTRITRPLHTYSRSLPPRSFAPGILGKPPGAQLYTITLSINQHAPLNSYPRSFSRHHTAPFAAQDTSFNHHRRSHNPSPSCRSPRLNHEIHMSIPPAQPADTSNKHNTSRHVPSPSPKIISCLPSAADSSPSPKQHAVPSLSASDIASSRFDAPVHLSIDKGIVDPPTSDTSSLQPTTVFHSTSQPARPKPRKFRHRYTVNDASLPSQPSPSSTSPQESSHVQSPSPTLKDSSHASQLTSAAPCTPRRTRSSAPACKSLADVATAAVKDASLTSYSDMSTLPNIPTVERRVCSAGKIQFVRRSLSGKKKKIAYRCYSYPVTRA